MSYEYDQYLKDHKANVAKGYYWLRDNLPEVAKPFMEWQICHNHDASKTDILEYDAYDRYFYGRNKSYQVVQDFNIAWLQHIHKNPHHWQYWVLINDDPGEGMVILDMPDLSVVEMICDWWAFSWKKGNLHEIFKWYDEHKEYMKLSKNTRKKVEDILEKIKNKLEEQK
jgi:hypothetical protein